MFQRAAGSAALFFVPSRLLPGPTLHFLSYSPVQPKVASSRQSLARGKPTTLK